MREILFRGKDIKGNWHIGLLAHIGNAWYISNSAGVATAFEVIPDTIGQFIGLTDKNGKKIFEGDLLSERPSMNQTEYIGYVAYDEKSAVWRFMIKNDTKYNGVLLGSYSNSYKVIGNIHDNPELLKEGVVE